MLKQQSSLRIARHVPDGEAVRTTARHTQDIVLKIQTSAKTIVKACIVYLVMALLAIVTINKAYGAKLPESWPIDSDLVIMDTIDDAARIGMLMIDPDAKVEYGGSIMTCKNKTGYIVTQPVTTNNKYGVSWETKAPKRYGACNIVARYHSHPNEDEGKYFSPIDIATANGESIPVYMIHRENIKVFRPKLSRTTIIKVSGQFLRVSLGESLQ